jgi:heptosyltransferase II
MLFSANHSAVHVLSRKWNKPTPPRRILAIRLQATGDMVITLPYLQHLRRNLPADTELDLLTREEVESIPQNLQLFNHVYSIGGGRNWKKQLILTCLLLPKLLIRRYDIVVDLQNNIISKTVRKTLMPSAWSEFDRYSPVPAGECTRLTIEASGLSCHKTDSNFTFKTNDLVLTELLKSNGWNPKNHLVLLNPAGAFSTRNWPIENYLGFARVWKKKFPHTQFLLIGTDFIAKKAAILESDLGEACINLVGKTTPAQAFALVQQLQLVISEDSGLMHMAWVSGIPTLALFGTTTGIRATPLGSHSYVITAPDLGRYKSAIKPPVSRIESAMYGYSAGQQEDISSFSVPLVFEKAVNLLRSIEKKAPTAVFLNAVEILKPR